MKPVICIQYNTHDESFCVDGKNAAEDFASSRVAQYDDLVAALDADMGDYDRWVLIDMNDLSVIRWHRIPTDDGHRWFEYSHGSFAGGKREDHGGLTWFVPDDDGETLPPCVVLTKDRTSVRIFDYDLPEWAAIRNHVFSEQMLFIPLCHAPLDSFEPFILTP